MKGKRVHWTVHDLAETIVDDPHIDVAERLALGHARLTVVCVKSAHNIKNTLEKIENVGPARRPERVHAGARGLCTQAGRVRDKKRHGVLAREKSELAGQPTQATTVY